LACVQEPDGCHLTDATCQGLSQKGTESVIGRGATTSFGPSA